MGLCKVNTHDSVDSTFWENSPKTTDVNIIAASCSEDGSEPLIQENLVIIKKNQLPSG